MVNAIFTVIDLYARYDAATYAVKSAQDSFGKIDSGSPLPPLPQLVPQMPA